MKKNNIFKFGLLAFFFLAYSLPALADLDPPNNEDDPPYEEAPIDNWQLLLVMVAVAAGIYFLTRKRKELA